MSDEKEKPRIPSKLFEIEHDSKRADIYRPPSLLRTTEWGLLTFGSLLAGLLFPPYFMSVLWLAFFNAGGLLWVTHLSENGRNRLKEFERDFSDGHAAEERGQFAEAITCYEALIPEYQDFPKIAEIAVRRIAYLKETQASALKARPKSKRRKKS